MLSDIRFRFDAWAAAVGSVVDVLVSPDLPCRPDHSTITSKIGRIQSLLSLKMANSSSQRNTVETATNSKVTKTMSELGDPAD